MNNTARLHPNESPVNIDTLLGSLSLSNDPKTRMLMETVKKRISDIPSFWLASFVLALQEEVTKLLLDPKKGSFSERILRLLSTFSSSISPTPSNVSAANDGLDKEAA